MVKYTMQLLWCKLFMNHINGQMYNAKLRCIVMWNLELIIHFWNLLTCGNGTRQGYLYPFLFSLYLNDLETFLENNNITGLNSLYDELEPKLTFFQRTIANKPSF